MIFNSQLLNTARPAPLLLAQLFAGMSIALSFAIAAPVKIEIGTLRAQMKYDTEEFTVPPGTEVHLTLKNTDDLPHNLVVCNAEGVSLSVAQAAWDLAEAGFEKQWIPDDKRILAATKMIDPQKTGKIKFTSPAKPGRYDYVCTYPGHAVLMKGVMHVGAGDSSPQKTGPIKDLTYTLYQGDWGKLPDFSKLTPTETDSIENGLITLDVTGKIRERFGIVFEGIITAPKAGEFTFATASDDGSQLFINDALVVNNDGVHGTQMKSGKIKLTKGEHRLRVTYFERSGEEILGVWWEGPGIRKKNRGLSKRLSPGGRSATGIPLVPQHRPLIYRNFIEGAGNRAIGVGYPGGINYAFDADQIRIALMWTDSFIDAARHWTGRGQGHQPPSGKNIIQTPPGEAFAVLDSADSPWPQATPRAEHTRFNGYRFWDNAGNPEFLYTLSDSLKIADRPVGVLRKDGQHVLERAVTITGNAPERSRLFMRVATGEIAKEKANTFLTSKGQRISVSGANAEVQNDELRIAINTSSGRASFSITYEWLKSSNPEQKQP